MNTAPKSPGRAATAARGRATCRAQPTGSPRRAHSRDRVGSVTQNVVAGVAGPCVSAQEVAPALGMRYRFGGSRGCGRAAEARTASGPPARARSVSPFRSREKKVPMIAMPALPRVLVAVHGVGGVLEVADQTLGARVARRDVHDPLRGRLHRRAEGLARAAPRSRAVWSLYDEVDDENALVGPRASGFASRRWKAMNVLPTPPRLLQKHTVCLGDMAPGFTAGRARARGRVIGLTPDWRVFFFTWHARRYVGKQIIVTLASRPPAWASWVPAVADSLPVARAAAPRSDPGMRPRRPAGSRKRGARLRLPALSRQSRSGARAAFRDGDRGRQRCYRRGRAACRSPARGRRDARAVRRGDHLCVAARPW